MDFVLKEKNSREEMRGKEIKPLGKKDRISHRWTKSLETLGKY